MSARESGKYNPDLSFHAMASRETVGAKRRMSGLVQEKCPLSWMAEDPINERMTLSQQERDRLKVLDEVKQGAVERRSGQAITAVRPSGTRGYCGDEKYGDGGVIQDYADDHAASSPFASSRKF